MKASADAYDLIKCFETFRARPYWCPGKVRTIGYGSTRYAKVFDEISHATALELLQVDVAHAEHVVERLVAVPLNQHQFDALISFVYNVGAGNFARSTLLKHLNAERYAHAAEEFKRWTYAGGLSLRGLAKRREAERALFLKPTERAAA